MSYYIRQPKRKPKKLPQNPPYKAIPSGIGDKGIVGNWLFYYLKGGDHLHDFSPYDNHGTLNGPVWKDGRYGWALSFDGVDDYVSVADKPEFEEVKFTVTAWFNADSLADWGEIVSKHGNNTGYVIETTGGDSIQGILGDGASWFSVKKTVSTGTWYYVALLYDGSEQKFYVDGDLVGTNTLDYAPTNSYQLWIGASEKYSNYFDGRICLVRIYTEVKSGSWIERRFERTKGIFK